jgi:hypothetical protein
MKPIAFLLLFSAATASFADPPREDQNQELKTVEKNYTVNYKSGQ